MNYFREVQRIDERNISLMYAKKTKKNGRQPSAVYVSQHKHIIDDLNS